MLTVKELKNLKPGRHVDSQGLILNATTSGTKSWIFRYQIKGRRREMGLGALSELGLIEARALASILRSKVAQGIDPIDERESIAAQESERLKIAAAGGVTFESLATEYINERVAPQSKNAKHVQQWRNSIRDYALPHIRNMHPQDIGLEEILAVLKPIWTTKTETASRLRGRLESVLAYARVLGLRTGDNPAAWRNHLDMVLPNPDSISPVQHHAALPYTDLPALFSYLTSFTGTPSLAARFSILTITRSDNARGAEWQEIDWENRIWTIPPEKMKGRKHSERTHRVPLSEQALDLLRHASQYRINDLVFPSTNKGIKQSDAVLSKLLKGFKDEITLHGTARSGFRDWAGNDTDYPSDVIEMCMAHVVGNSTERAYRRDDALTKRRALMQHWADHCIPNFTGPAQILYT